MKRKASANRSAAMLFTLAAGTFFSLILAVQAPVSAAGPSYPMVCRGGGNMQADFMSNGHIQLYFSAGRHGAGTAPPRPGECTWLDRGLRPGEPRSLVWNSRERVNVKARFHANGRLSGFHYVNGSRRRWDQFRYLVDKVRSDHVFHLHARQETCSGRKCPFLSVKRVGP